MFEVGQTVTVRLPALGSERPAQTITGEIVTVEADPFPEDSKTGQVIYVQTSGVLYQCSADWVV